MGYLYAMGSNNNRIINLYMKKESNSTNNNASMSTKYDDISWQKKFLEMKAHKPSDVRLLIKGAKGIKDAWRLGVLHVEYERLRKMQEEQQQQ